MNTATLCASAALLFGALAPPAGSAGFAPIPTDNTPALADRSAYLGDLTTELTKRWPDNRMVTIVCHGHSVPSGYFRGAVVQPFDAYPHLTHRLLQDHFPTSMVEVIRAGVGGEHAEQGAARFASDVLAKQPDVVTIDYALNDRAIGLERALEAWTAMISAAQDAGVRVILLTPTPDTRADLEDPDDPLNRHAAQIRELARLHGVGLVDSLELFRAATARGVDLDSLMSQANHPNRRGHEIVARALADWFIPPAGE